MTYKGFTFTYAPRDGTNIVDTPGVDFGARVRLIARFGEYAVIRIPGGTHWQGIGMDRASHPAQWLLVKIEHERRSARASLSGEAWERYRATVVEASEPGRQWRMTREYFTSQARKRATHCACGGFYSLASTFVHGETCSPRKRAAFLKATGYAEGGS